MVLGLCGWSDSTRVEAIATRVECFNHLVKDVLTLQNKTKVVAVILGLHVAN